MNILITGSSGFIGSRLIDSLIDSGHDVTAIDAVSLSHKVRSNAFRFVQSDTTEPGQWQESIKIADTVINLSGQNIFHRWTDKYKQKIYDSRILTTRNIVNAFPEGKSMTLISTSAAGYYGNCGDEILDENKGAGDDFLARVCIDWEKEALLARKKGVRVMCARFGVVLGANGGALSKMVPAYRLFVGGPLGNGRQWFPWIQIDDLIGAIYFVLNNDDIDGPVNFCSPNPVRNNEFSKSLGHVLNRPSFFRTPAFMLRLAAGELGDLFLNSQRAVPSLLIASGYTFKFPGLFEALKVSVS
ncbi:MAG: TIGR01777 family protein [Desulfobacteraceae bacterium]|nr:TIGR01777 family protein [Desulfobacteraceae bacterium]MBC2755942.1 TIGR01777 family protein [Desulfobacteraceae bacterium]